MITKLDLYKVFCQVGKSKSFSKASKELYMTQPAVSQAIMQLERELDIRLFNRTPKGVSLTNEGSLLFEYVNSAINLINVGEGKILEFKGLTVGELKIGVGDTISKYFLLPYLEVFHNRYPNLKFKIINGTTIELCALIKSGEIDIAICNFPIDDSSLQLIPCAEIKDIFVCGGQVTGFTFKSTALLIYMALLSSVAFAIWSELMKYNKVGTIAMFNFLIPVFGTLLSAIILGENIFDIKILIALILVCTGIFLVYRVRPEKVQVEEVIESEI